MNNEVRISGAEPTDAAMRMRRHRERRREGLCCLTVELRESEIDELVRLGVLSAGDRADKIAVLGAFYEFLDGTLSRDP